MATTHADRNKTASNDDESKLDRLRGQLPEGSGALIGAAAAGLVAGLFANVARKALVQAPSALAGDWFDLIKAEHKMALTIVAAMEKTTNDDTGKRATLLMQLKHAIGKHAFTEENAIYPLLRDQGVTTEADKLNHEHGYIKQGLYELTAMEKSSPTFLPTLAKLKAELEHHMNEEEKEIFPVIRAKLSPEQNKALTLAANKEGLKLA